MKSMKAIQNGSVGVHTLFVKFRATKTTLPDIIKRVKIVLKLI